MNSPETPLSRALLQIECRLTQQVPRPGGLDVAHIRKRIGMTQRQFAWRFGFSVATLRHWERGDRKPRGPALVLLHVIDRDPKAVVSALMRGQFP